MNASRPGMPMRSLQDASYRRPDRGSLCGLVNTYFQEWDRLIIIERLAYTEPLWYGYVVVAFGPDGPEAVTNMAPEHGSPWGWLCGLRPRRVRIDRERLAPVIADLDGAIGASSRGALLWFDAVDTPICVLHDVRADGHAFSFGIRGYGEEGREWLKYELASRFLEHQVRRVGAPHPRGAGEILSAWVQSSHPAIVTLSERKRVERVWPLPLLSVPHSAQHMVTLRDDHATRRSVAVAVTHPIFNTWSPFGMTMPPGEA